MSEISDDVLMAYADGALDHDERARLEAIITERPDLQSRIAMFAATGKTLGVPFAAIAREAPPQRLIDAVMGDHVAQPVIARTKASGGERGTRRSWRFPRLSLDAFALPLAGMTAMLLIGVGIGWYAASLAIPADALYALDGGELVARGALAHALETSPSGPRVRSSDEPQIRLSFKSPAGYCRQYEIAIAPGEGIAGMACRRADDRWHVIAHESANISPAGGGTKPAGASGTALIEGALDRLMEGDPLGADEEKSLISRRWQR